MGILLAAAVAEAKVINIVDWESKKKVMPYGINSDTNGVKRSNDYTNSAKDDAQCAIACKRAAGYTKGKTCGSGYIRVACPVAGCSAWAICILEYN